MIFRPSKNSIENRSGVDERLIEVSDLAFKLTLIDFGHGRDSGLRTASRQFELYTSDLSKCDGTLEISPHQSGQALDFFAYVDGEESWDELHLSMVACAFLQAAAQLNYPLEWGGLWGKRGKDEVGWDMPHVQIKRRDIYAGSNGGH